MAKVHAEFHMINKILGDMLNPTNNVEEDLKMLKRVLALIIKLKLETFLEIAKTLQGID